VYLVTITHNDFIVHVTVVYFGPHSVYVVVTSLGYLIYTAIYLIGHYPVVLLSCRLTTQRLCYNRLFLDIQSFCYNHR